MPDEQLIQKPMDIRRIQVEVHEKIINTTEEGTPLEEIAADTNQKGFV